MKDLKGIKELAEMISDFPVADFDDDEYKEKSEKEKPGLVALCNKYGITSPFETEEEVKKQFNEKLKTNKNLKNTRLAEIARIFGMPTSLQIEDTKKLSQFIPSLDNIKFYEGIEAISFDFKFGIHGDESILTYQVNSNPIEEAYRKVEKNDPWAIEHFSPSELKEIRLKKTFGQSNSRMESLLSPGAIQKAISLVDKSEINEVGRAFIQFLIRKTQPAQALVYTEAFYGEEIGLGAKVQHITNRRMDVRKLREERVPLFEDEDSGTIEHSLELITDDSYMETVLRNLTETLSEQLSGFERMIPHNTYGDDFLAIFQALFGKHQVSIHNIEKADRKIMTINLLTDRIDEITERLEKLIEQEKLDLSMFVLYHGEGHPEFLTIEERIRLFQEKHPELKE